MFYYWENSAGEIVGRERTLVLTADTDEAYTAVYGSAMSATMQYRYRTKEYTSSYEELGDPWIFYKTTSKTTHDGYDYVYLPQYTVSGTGTGYGYTANEAEKWKLENNTKYCFHGRKVEVLRYKRMYISASPEYLYVTDSSTIDHSKYFFSGNYWCFTVCKKKAEQTIYYYYQWSEWSEWSDTPITATVDREVETRGVYVVSYDANGGTNAPESQVKIQGENIVLSSDILTREGHTFLGWSTANNGSVEYEAGAIYSADESATLCAVWKPHTYTITYDANGGVNVPALQVKTYGVDLFLSTTEPKRNGYTFLGWATSSDGAVVYNAGGKYTVDENITLYAIWDSNFNELEFASNGDGTCSVSGIGSCSDSNVVIPARSPSGDAVTSIGERAFSDQKNIISITIPDSVMSIDYYAFEGCTSLESILVPNSVTWIGSGAFSGCKSLKSVTLPFLGNSRKTPSSTNQYPFGYIFGTDNYTGGVATIQSYLMNSNNYTQETYYIPSSLKSVTITGGEILYGAFYNCSGLESITITSDITNIGLRAFYNCKNLKNIVIPNSVTNIESSAFRNCMSLESIIMPNKLTNICSYAFYGCVNLRYVFLPDNQISVGSDVYYNANLVTEYCFSANLPTDTIGNYWHYDENGNPVIW